MLSAQQTLDTYFLETRAKLLEIAATLDRIDRSTNSLPATDPRLTFIQNALDILKSNTPNRAEKIQLLYSLQ